jgi:hypothetical protein
MKTIKEANKVSLYRANEGLSWQRSDFLGVDFFTIASQPAEQRP